MPTLWLRARREQLVYGVAIPFTLAYLTGVALRLVRFALAIFAASGTTPLEQDSTFAGEEIAIKCWENGRYLEVGDDDWIFASAFTHNKHAARFHVEAVPPELLRSLVTSWQFEERPAVKGSRLWDMRVGDEQDPYGSNTDAAYLPAEQTDASTSQAIDDEDDIDAMELRRREREEAARIERRRRRLESAAAQGGARGWVFLRSPYAAGYVEVSGRGEGDEYVVRISKDGKLSYRSLFLLQEDAVWSHAVGGYLNWRRATDSDPRQHLRAHGNTEPWQPLRTLASSARLRVTSVPPVIDVLGSIPCPTAVPPFDWALLLDAARAGSCGASDLRTLRRSATALTALRAALGPAYGAELEDLANAYRTILLDPEWENVLDLQLAPCSGRPAAARPRGFSWLEGGDLRVDAAQCPRAAYSEVMLRPTPDDPLALEMSRLQTSPPEEAAGAAGSQAASLGGNETANGQAAPQGRAPPLRAELLTDAVFVLCDYADPTGDGNEYPTRDEGETSSSTPDAAPEGEPQSVAEEDEGESSSVATEQGDRVLLQDLWFRISHRVKYHAGWDATKRKKERSASAIDAAAPEEVSPEDGVPPPPPPPPAVRLSVLMLQIDATSRAHMRRMLPSSIALLRAMAANGQATLYEFPHYQIVGFNSLPNMVPMLAGVDAKVLIDAAPVSAYEPSPPGGGVRGVWSDFEARGYATSMLEELHDGCSDLMSPTPSSASKLFYSRLGAGGMPHHNAWQIFCQPELRPCCNDKGSFLQPGRRQCVGERELPELLMDYMRQVWDLYSHRSTPRFGVLNLMSAHEHFMTRLGALDAPLRAFLLSMEALLRRDTALFLLADHGTHGIWYNHFAVGQAEHRAPALMLLLPAGFAQAHPAAHAALVRNQHRRVTAFDLHATLRHLAHWPAMPQPAVEASSLFVDLPDGRSCEEARIPAEWCVDSPRQCFEDELGTPP